MLAVELTGYVPAGAAAEVSVTIVAPDRVMPGSSFTATVNISQVVELNAVQYEIVFDPSVLRLDDVTPGKVDSTAMPVKGFTLVSPGRYRVLQMLLFNKVSGSGHLAALQFSAVGSGGSSPIGLANGKLSNWQAEAIPATWTGDTVSIASAESSGGSLPAPTQTTVPVPPPAETPVETGASEGNIGGPAGREGSENLSVSVSTPFVREEVRSAVSPSEVAPSPATEAAAPPAPEAAPKPSPEAEPAMPVSWPVLWGVIAGVSGAALLILWQVRRRAYFKKSPPGGGTNQP